MILTYGQMSDGLSLSQHHLCSSTMDQLHQVKVHLRRHTLYYDPNTQTNLLDSGGFCREESFSFYLKFIGTQFEVLYFVKIISNIKQPKHNTEDNKKEARMENGHQE